MLRIAMKSRTEGRKGHAEVLRQFIDWLCRVRGSLLLTLPTEVDVQIVDVKIS